MTTYGAAPPKSVLRSMGLIVLLTVLVPLTGCHSGGSGPTAPGAIEVQISARSVQLTRAVTATAVAADGRDRLDVAWLVDGVVGGADSTGTITQGNPATYTAPPAVPDGGRVVVEARLASHAPVSAADTLEVLFTVRHVDAQAGDDGTGTGTWAAPLKTVSAALVVAEAGDTVFVRPGTYDVALGEWPPYNVPEDVMLRGAHRDSCTLYGHGSEGNVIDLEDGAGIEHVTIANADRDVTAINTSFAASIRWIVVTEPFGFAAIRAANGSEAVIEDCRLENTRRPYSDRGMELIWGSRATVRRCTLRGWHEGAFLSGPADPLIEDSVFEDNIFGLNTYETSADHTEPDLGGGLRGSQGGNTIRGNASCGLASRTPGTIFAINNTWNVAPVDPPVYCSSVGDSCDICVTNGGAVFWCDCTPP